jgi:hypothetical protein
MPRQQVAILLFSVLALPGFVQYVILVDFNLNRDYIAATLCINKEQPITVCGGTCYLSEELEQTESPSEKQLPSSFKIKNTGPFSLDEQVQILFNRKLLRKNSHLSYLEKLKGAQINKNIFRPPIWI